MYSDMRKKLSGKCDTKKKNMKSQHHLWFFTLFVLFFKGRENCYWNCGLSIDACKKKQCSKI